jgi:protein O-GlcNAc transferase
MNAPARLDAARQLYVSGDFAGARRAAEAILQAPRDAREASDARLVLVECVRRAGDPAAGVAHARAAVDANPDDALAHHALAICLGETGDRAGAIANMQRAVLLNPNRADAWNELGIALHGAGRLAEAEAAYRRALSVQPDFPRAECNLAVLQRDSGRADVAEVTLRAVIARQPMAAAFRPALSSLADLLRARGELDEAAALYLRAAKQAPDNSAGEMLDLGMVLAERDDSEQARKAFGHSLRQDPHQLRAALAMHLTLPVIYTDALHVARARVEYARGLETLERELSSRMAGMGASQVADELIWSNFYLAYQGEQDRDLQARYAALAARALDGADVQWRAPMPAEVVVGRKIRIGFVSALLREHTVGRYFMRWITDLDRERFEVWFYALTASVDAVTEAITARADHVRTFVGGEAAPSAIAPLIRSDLLDILIYPELGMDQVTFALGALRLAPRQYAAWGHPVTTGHATIDAFLSCEAMEPEDAQTQYSEPLALLPGIGTRFAPAELPARRGREAYSLPRDATLLLCPQSLFKIHPDNDLLFARILAANPRAILVLFAGRHPAITDRFMRRLGRCLERHAMDIRKRARVLPQMPHADYLAVNLECDAMLDTLRWSGGQTSVDALRCALPIVTLPGTLMRARQSAAMLTLLGLQNLVATDVDDYVRIATRLCSDPEWRAQASRRMRDHSASLLDDAAPIHALEAFLLRAVATPVPAKCRAAT